LPVGLAEGSRGRGGVRAPSLCWRAVADEMMHDSFGLDPRTVHVWGVPITDPPFPLEVLRAHLSASERDRASRFHFDADRLRYVVGRGVLRELLGRYTGAEPGALRFAYGEHGKPAPEGYSELDFNVSHSGDWVVIGVARGVAVGVDVERIRAVSDLEGIVERRFTVSEASRILALPEPDRTVAFFTCWTRKEACLKALGAGLSASLDRFEVSERVDDPCPLKSVAGAPHHVANWSLWSLVPEPGYLAAVAVESPDFVLRARKWSGLRGVEAWSG